MAYNDDRKFKKVGSGPAGRSSPMSKPGKSIVNPNKNATYNVRPDAPGGAAKGLSKGGTPPMFTGKGGIGMPGKSPSTPAVKNSRLSPFTSSPFSGRSNMGAKGGTGMSGPAKAWANKKSGGRP